MNKYEGVFIFEPNMEEESRNELFEKVKGIIEENGSITDIDEWGNRKLAYEIKDFTEGYYIVIKFETAVDAINEIGRICKISEKVIRHMIVNDDE
ncbi:30S ribosomal protein S6 [Clostridiisalibacter paucivorans]|uniref:30S ribosomal protein S6 n=1 Tax=Clostridiisalibacter paucivorans TaxID=408753 RepID=UPI00047B3160|nr:30S ribosomal protein S6 [Clostridiisalibacter paucivorans]